jgi:ribosomal protein L3 glutamine methyltransferase
LTDISPAEQLLTVRDFLRYAISRFNQAGLAFGHGASTAFDDAAYLVLEGLKLPIDTLEPFLDARLLPAERQRLADLIEARVTTRKPTPYLLNRAYIQGVPFFVDERVIVPRSFIGELIHSEFFGGEEFTLIDDLSSIETVLDLCTGSASLAILAAGVFENAEIDAVDLSPDALEVARINVAEHNLGNPDRAV